MYANDGWVRDFTDERRLRDLDQPEEMQLPPDVRLMVARCGGCPWRQEQRVSEALLNDAEIGPTLRWLTFQGWAVDQIRCPYCTGEKPRPDDPLCAPYPVSEAS